MSDYEYVDPAETLDEQGAPLEDAEWDSDFDFDQFEEEPSEQEPGEINPLVDYPPGPPQGVFEEQLGNELRRAAWGEAYHDDLSAYVREAAAAPEFDIRDEAAVERVTLALLAAREELFAGWVAGGATVHQAIQALGDIDLENGIRVALEGERFENFKRSDSSLASWQQGRQAMDAERALLGKEPLPSPYDSPSLQRMARQTAAYAERQQAWQEQQRAVTDRVYGKQWWR